MKTKSLLYSVVYMLSLAFIGCDSNPASSQNSNLNSSENQTIDMTELEKIVADDLSPAEEAGLLFMREEEKVARDVYAYFYNKYKLNVFSNINKSETVHTYTIKYLLDRYGLQDPMVIDNPGIFVNQDLQNLHNQLIEQGNVSDVEALKVGALIEEVDIIDLFTHLKETDNQDLTYVYSNLEKGSENHLRAFVGNLANRGIVYSPVKLDVKTYNSIIN